MKKLGDEDGRLAVRKACRNFNLHNLFEGGAI
jgi:hypothetical protein